MQITLKMMQKLDGLLTEADEYITCANAHADNPELKATYLDLARCHYDGYEKLSKCAERAVEQKADHVPHGQAIKEMVAWHKDQYDERAEKVHKRLQNAR